MDLNAKVMVMGVQRRVRVDDDGTLEDGPREGLPGTLIGEEPGDRLVVELDRGGVVSCDAADVEEVT